MAQQAGAGEILLQLIDHENMNTGYDTSIIKQISGILEIPLVVCGGASSVRDFCEAVRAGASAVAAGSMFIYKGKHKAVLINYPEQSTLINDFYTQV